MLEKRIQSFHAAGPNDKKNIFSYHREQCQASYFLEGHKRKDVVIWPYSDVEVLYQGSHLKWIGRHLTVEHGVPGVAATGASLR